MYDLIVAVMNITISTQNCLPDFHMIWSSTDVVYECLRDSFEEKRALLHHLQILIKKDDEKCFCNFRAANNGWSMDNVLGKNRVFPVKSLDGRTICPVVYAGKEKI